jgi:hypothetical protein
MSMEKTLYRLVGEEFKEEEESFSWRDSTTSCLKLDIVTCLEIESITSKEIEGSLPFKISDTISIF